MRALAVGCSLLCWMVMALACGGDSDSPAVDAAAVVDAPIDAIDDAAVDAIVDATIDGSAPSGTVCQNGATCASGFCVDGVCCDLACTDGCLGCTAALTGQPDGTCAPVTSGTDPHAACEAGTIACTTATCDGNGACTRATDGTTCRTLAGACDRAEVCAAGTCPADQFVDLGSETTCRPSAGDCDSAELCDGTSAQCPPDLRVASGSVCRTAVGVCDAAETCNGTATDCPADALAGSGTECRAAAGACDAAETCTGTASTCPSDLKRPAGTQCRASAGTCDVSETCDGNNASCPADAFMPTTAPLCAPYTCPGTGASCLTSCMTTADCAPDMRTVCNAGVCTPGKLAFVTSSGYIGSTLGGLVGADAACQQRATAANLTGTFKAWLSTTTVSASSRLTHSTVPYVLTYGKSIIANDWADLTDGSLDRAINATQLGQIAANVVVWTGTGTDGNSSSSTCAEWTSHLVFGQSGISFQSNSNWTQNNTQAGCATSGRLYCLEQ